MNTIEKAPFPQEGGPDAGGVNSRSKDRDLFAKDASPSELFAPSERLKNSKQILRKSEILQSLVKTFKPLDFLVLKYPTETTEQIKARHDNSEKVKPNDHKVLIINEILKAAKDNNCNLCKQGGDCYVYNGAFWERLDKDDLKQFISDCCLGMGVPLTTATEVNFVDSLYRQFTFSAHLQPPEFSKDKVLINLQNGTFEITTQGVQQRGFSPEDFLTYQLPFSYHPKAEYPIFMKYLNRVLPDPSAQALLAEYCGYLFIRHGNGLKFEKCLVLYGKGANGKSVFYEILTALLGKENVSCYTLQDLTDQSGYYRAEIGDKLVNYASEISRQMNSDLFKKLASGEPFSARHVYERPIEVIHYAKMIFNANELPKDTEHTNAFFRRFYIIPFLVTIPEAEQDKELHRKIIDSELAGVFNWILDGLERLLRNRNFTFCQAAADCLKQYQIDSDSVASFLEDKDYHPGISESMPLKELYQQYKEYCYDDGYRACSLRTFSDRLQAKGYEVKKGHGARKIFIDKMLESAQDVDNDGINETGAPF